MWSQTYCTALCKVKTVCISYQAVTMLDTCLAKQSGWHGTLPSALGFTQLLKGTLWQPRWVQDGSSGILVTRTEPMTQISLARAEIFCRFKKKSKNTPEKPKLCLPLSSIGTTTHSNVFGLPHNFGISAPNAEGASGYLALGGLHGICQSHLGKQAYDHSFNNLNIL